MVPPSTLTAKGKALATEGLVWTRTAYSTSSVIREGTGASIVSATNASSR